MNHASIEEVNSVQRRVKIEIPKESIDQAFEKKFKEIQAKAQLQGFRPGKAPMAMIRKLYLDRARYDIFEDLVELHLFSTLGENKISPVASPVLEAIEKLPTQGESFSFTALIDILPTFALPQYKGLNLTVPKNTKVEEEIDNELKQIQQRFAKEKSVEETATAELGMKASISHTCEINGENIPDFAAKGVDFVLGSGFLYKDLEDAVVGMKVGETKLVHVNFPENYAEKKVAGKHVHFQITLDKLANLELPAIDDELAKDTGSENLEQLKSNIKKRLEGAKSRIRFQHIENAIFDELAKSANFEVPPAMADRVIDEMIREGLPRQLSEKEVKAALADKEQRTGLLDLAKRRCRNTLILMEIIKAENITVEDSDIDDYIERRLGMDRSSMGDLFTQYREIFKKQGNTESLLFDKAIKLIESQSTISEK